MAKKFKYESAEPLWPRQVLFLVPAGLLIGLILGQCSFDDPNPLKNSWTWLGVFGVILCALAWTTIRAQYTVARQIRLGIMLSLITHVALLFAMGNATFSLSSRGELPPQFTPWRKKEVPQQVYLGEPKIEVIPRQETQPPVDTESLKTAVLERSPRHEEPVVEPDDLPLAAPADAIAQVELAPLNRPDDEQLMPLTIQGSPMLRRQIVEGVSQPTSADDVPAAAPPAEQTAQSLDAAPLATNREPLAPGPSEPAPLATAPRPAVPLDRRVDTAQSVPSPVATAADSLPRQRRAATTPAAPTAAAAAPQEASPSEVVSAPQLRPVPGRADRAVGTSPSGANFGQPVTDLTKSMSPTLLPPLAGSPAIRGDIAGTFNPPADTARPVARRPAATVVPGAVADDVAQPPLRAIPPGAGSSAGAGSSSTASAGPTAKVDTGRTAKTGATGSGDGTAIGGRRASGNVTVPTLALPGLSGTGAENVTRAGGPNRSGPSDVATVTHLQEDRFINRRVGGLPAINAPVRDRAEAFRSRRPLGRSGGDFGPSQLGAKAEDAIQLGLEFLVRYQLPDGRWSLHSFRGATVSDAGSVHSDAAATGLALLSFLGAGYDHYDPKYETTVRSGLAFLVKNQKPDGDLYVSDDTESNKSAWLYTHAIAALALCESYGMTGDKKLEEPAQRAIDFIVKSQNMSTGGWRYTPGVSADTSVTGWQLMALKSGELAGLKVPRSTLDRIKGWLDYAQVEGSNGARYTYNPSRPLSQDPRDSRRPTMTSVGLLMRLYLGWNREHPAMVTGAKILQAAPPEMGQRDAWIRDTYYWYYATQVMYHMGGDYWKTWNERLHSLLLSTQIRTGDARGSWDPISPVPDRWGSHGGRIYVTTLNLLSLEVTYRNLPIYESTAQ